MDCSICCETRPLVKCGRCTLECCDPCAKRMDSCPQCRAPSAGSFLKSYNEILSLESGIRREADCSVTEYFRYVFLWLKSGWNPDLYLETENFKVFLLPPFTDFFYGDSREISIQDLEDDRRDVLIFHAENEFDLIRSQFEQNLVRIVFDQIRNKNSEN